MSSQYSDLAEHPIRMEAAREVYEILGQYPANYLARLWLTQVEERWARGEDLRDLARIVLRASYRWHEKLMLMSPFNGGETKEMCLAIYAACGVDPPAHPGYRGHGAA